MSDGDVLLAVKDVSLELGGQQILQGVNFEIHDRVRPGTVTGQLVGLLGQSGIGKTRLLRIIAGLDQPDSGVVLGPNGKPLDPKQVGVVFQSYPLLRHRTVLGNLEVAGVIDGLAHAEARKRAKQLLERFRLADRANHYPAQLSGGQRQRVAIAQQILCHKTFLLMDEPFSGLDPQALDEVIKLLIEVANMDELNTIIVITHDIWAAMVACDTLVMLGRTAGAKHACVQTTYDLVARGLAWRTHVEQDPKFSELEREIRAAFKC